MYYGHVDIYLDQENIKTFQDAEINLIL